jgi:hypothetical protein
LMLNASNENCDRTHRGWCCSFHLLIS